MPVLIFALVLGILVLAFFIPVGIEFLYNGELYIKINYLFVKRTVYPKKPDKRAEKTEKEKPKQEDPFKQAVKEKGFVTAVSEYAAFVVDVLKKIRWVFAKSFVKDFVLRIDVASPDPAVTAIQYGGVCGIVYPLMSFASTLTKFIKPRTEINADFDSQESTIRFKFKLFVFPVFVVVAVIALMIKYITTIKDDTKVKSIKIKEV